MLAMSHFDGWCAGNLSVQYGDVYSVLAFGVRVLNSCQAVPEDCSKSNRKQTR